MSVAEVDRIDFMSLDEKTSILWLNMTEHREWRTLGPDFEEIKAKTNLYLNALQSPEFAKQTPQAQGRSLGIRVLCERRPSGDAMKFMAFIKQRAGDLGIAYQVLLQGASESFSEVTIGESSFEHQVIQKVGKKPWWKAWG